MDSLLEGTLFTAGGCGHCSLGNQFEDGLMVSAFYMAAGFFTAEMMVLERQ